MQMRMRDLAAAVGADGTDLPRSYHPAVPLVVRVRFSGLRRRCGDLLAHDRAACCGI